MLMYLPSTYRALYMCKNVCTFLSASGWAPPTLSKSEIIVMNLTFLVFFSKIRKTDWATITSKANFRGKNHCWPKGTAETKLTFAKKPPWWSWLCLENILCTDEINVEHPITSKLKLYTAFQKLYAKSHKWWYDGMGLPRWFTTTCFNQSSHLLFFCVLTNKKKPFTL